jgi:hypothetical protein
VWQVPTGCTPLERWGSCLCLIAGFGIDGVKFFAEELADSHDDWKYWATCSAEELAIDILEAQSSTGYAIGILRVDFVQVTRILEQEDKLEHAPKWYRALAILHIAKYCRYQNVYGPEALSLFVAYRHRTSQIPLEHEAIKQPLTAAINMTILKAFGSVLRMPTILSLANSTQIACPIAVIDLLSFIHPRDLISSRDPKQMVELIPSPSVAFQDAFIDYSVYDWFQPGIVAYNIARINADGTIDKNARVRGINALAVAWATSYRVDKQALLRWRSLLPDRVDPHLPSDFIKKYILNFNDLGCPAGVFAYLDGVILLDLVRDHISGSRIGNAIAAEYPLLFIMPTGSTEEETTNQGKTALARILGQCLVPQLKEIHALRSSSAPAQRSMATPIERHGTAIFDEFLLPTAFDHFLNQAGIQSLSTGSTSTPGRAMENSEGISLKHPLVFSSKVAALPPDLINRMVPLFMDAITLDTSATDEELELICSGKLALLMRLSAILWIQKNGFTEIVRGLSPMSGPLRFKGHQAVISHLLHGDLSPLSAYIAAAAAQMASQKEAADASGLSDAIGIQTGFLMEFYWENCQDHVLEDLFTTYRQKEHDKKPFRVIDAMRMIIQDNGNRRLDVELNKHRKSEHAASNCFITEMKSKAFSRSPYTMTLIRREESLMKDSDRKPVPHIVITKTVIKPVVTT